jgi:prepilin-type N-terminal cleavage/methylation domain-containing protein
MEKIAFANIKRKAFSLIEVLVALIILTIVGVALVNTVVLFLQLRLINSMDNHMVDAASNLASMPQKVKNCTAISDPCAIFNTTDCKSSVSCNQTYCTSNNTCVVCYTNPQNGKAFYYGFNASLISNSSTTPLGSNSTNSFDVYQVTLCRSYAGKTKEQTFIIHVPSR